MLLLSFSAAPVFIGGLVGVLHGRAYLARAARGALSRDLVHLDEQVSDLYARLRGDATLARGFLQELPETSLRQAIRAVASTRPAYGIVSVIGPEGDLVASAARPGWRARPSPYYAIVARELSMENVAILPVEVLSGDSVEFVRPTLAVVAPLARWGRRPAAALVLQVDADTLVAVFRQASASSVSGRMAVVAGDGHFLFGSSAKETHQELFVPRAVADLSRLFDPAPVRAILSGRAGELVVSDRLISYRPVGPSPLHPDEQLIAYEEVVRAELMAPVRRVGWLVAGAVSFLLALGLVVSLLAARRVTGPIVQLRDATRLVARGRAFPAPVVPSGDELGDLADDFAAMAREVEMRQEALEAKADALRQSEERYRTLIENANDMIWAVDRQGNFTFFNRQAEIVSGERLEDWLGKSFAPLIHPDDLQSAHEVFRKTLAGEAVHYRTRVRAKEGEIVLSVSTAPISQEGEIVGTVSFGRDITEQERAEQACLVAETRYRTLFEQLPVGVVVIDPETARAVEFNDAAPRQLGYTGEEFAGLAIRDYEAAEKPEETRARVEKILREGWDEFETRHRTKQGRLRDVHVVVRKIELADRAYFYTIFDDVTERKRAQNALHAVVHGTAGTTGEGFFRSLVRHLGVALETRYVVVGELLGEGKDRVRTIAVWARDGIAENFEYDLAGTPCENIMERGQCCYSGGVREQFPDDRLLADLGVESYLGTPLFDSTGAAIGLLAVLDDKPMLDPTTGESLLPVFASRAAAELERRRSETALRQSEANYRSMVQGAPYGIYRSTRDGRFVSTNAALVEMLGYESEDELFPVEMETGLYADPAERERLVRERGDRNGFVGIETRWKRRDGTLLTVRLSGRVLRNERGEPEGFEGFVEDISERRNLEEQLRQSQKLEALGQLAGGVAHDFNNLLTTVLASGELMAREVPAGSRLAEDLDAVRLAAERGAELTRKLLAFGRHHRLERRPLDLNAQVRDFVRLARRVVPENIQFLAHGEEGAAVVCGDAGALDQVLMNLVTNARDAMPGGGALAIQTGRARLDEAFCKTHGWGAPGEYVVLAVSDTGTGMNEEVRRRVFEPFYTTKPVGAGTGLGMAMVYGLVKQHDGHLVVYSEPGRGTTVKAYLPAAVGEAPKPAAALPPARGGTETILLVEDEESLRHAARRVLQKAGYTVLVACDGVEALEVFEAHEGEIASVVSDVVMPRLGGPQFAAELQRRGKTPRILFMSGYTARDMQQSKTLYAHSPFLSKPWAITDLLRSVREVLDS